MCKRTKLVLIASSLILGFSGFAAYKAQQRRPASTAKWIPHEFNKNLAPTKTVILPLEKTPDSANQEVTLIGHITVNNSIDSDLSYMSVSYTHLTLPTKA